MLRRLLRRGAPAPKPARARPRASAEAVEPRVLYSADPFGQGAVWSGAAEVRVLEDRVPELKQDTREGAPLQDIKLEALQQVEAEAAPRPSAAPPAATPEPFVPSALLTPAAQPPAAPSPAPAEPPVAAPLSAGGTLVFVDAGVKDISAFTRALPSDAQLVQLQAGLDGVEQMAKAVAGLHDLRAIHIISHGSSGELLLGSAVLDETAMVERYADALARIGQALSPTGDLFVYGCDFAAGTAGQGAAQALAELTGAQVSASTDTTGSQALGGDWVLEFSTGPVEARQLFDDQNMAAYSATLATYTVTNLNNSGAGSLRQAITDANANGGADTIAFSVFGTINLSSALPSITGQVSINGTNAGAPGIVLNGGGTVGTGLQFDAGASNSTLRGLVVQNFSSYGIRVIGASGVTIAGNYVGTNSAGSGAAGNNVGIDLFDASNTTIGGTVAADRNIVSGNNNIGINIVGSGAGNSGTVVQGNYIGINTFGSGSLGNAFHGVYINGSTGVTVGGSASGAGNLIGNNSTAGITIGSTGSGNTIAGNTIGLNLAGSGTMANGTAGVWLMGSGNTVGGTTAAERNVISGNTQLGIRLSGASATSNTVAGNTIGTGPAGTTDMGNGEDGIQIDTGASNNIIGGTVAGAGNIIAGNNNAGIAIDDAASAGNQVLGNWIGVGSNGTTMLANSHNGINVNAATGTVIGDGTVSGRNIIASNSLHGIGIGNASNTVVKGNWLAYNGWDGINVNGTSSGTVIGGDDALSGNLIAYNTFKGILVTSSSNTAAAILSNQIYSNGDRGIELNNNGYDVNDAGDGDSGPNGLQNYPVLTSAAANTTGTTIAGSLNSTASQTFRIDFYTNRPGDVDGTNGEGARWLGFTTVTTNGSGNASINATLSNVWVNQGDRISATATRDLGGGSYGGTSEFAANITATASGVVVVDTTSDTSDGTTTSITNLGNARGGDGKISLREAMAAVNNTANGASADRIVFAIAPNIESSNINTALQTPTITVGSTLTAMTQAVNIDASTQPGYTSAPLVRLDAGGAVTYGVQLNAGSTGSTVRGLAITGFSTAGISISSSNSNTIAGNYIGLDPDGQTVNANKDAILITGSSGTIVGGTSVADRNVISGNTGTGVKLIASTNSVVYGNYIGTDANGLLDVNGTAANSLNSGVVISGGSGNQVGGTLAGQRNVISGNNWYGVELLGSTTNNTVAGNYIGTDKTGLVALGNTSGGASFWGSSTGNLVGGNTISGNLGYGILVGSAANGSQIQGNYIGVGADGSTSLGNASIGIEVGAGSTLVGTNADGNNDAAEANTISANSEGIRVLGAGTNSTQIYGNYIGTDASGLLDRGNLGDGVLVISGAGATSIGGTSATRRNIISGNAGRGIYIDVANVTVQGNYVGLNAAGTAALGNDNYGIDMGTGGTNATIGGAAAGAGNVVSGNGNAAVLFESGSSGTVLGNRIGTNAAGSATIAGIGAGVFIATSNVTVGGIAAGEANIISGASTDGVIVSNGTGNRIVGNAIYSNAGLSIDLADNGVTANDAAPDSDTGPNNLQNFPVLATARTNASNQLILTGTLTSATNSFYRIHFYSSSTQDSSGYGPAETYLGFADVPTNGSGVGTISTTLAVNVPVGSFITATATRATDGTYSSFTDTSELARNIAAISSVQATVTVDTASDTLDGDATSISTLLANKGADGLISLREAIAAANGSPNGTGGEDIISFAIGSGSQVISLNSQLPTITERVRLDGWTQPGYGGTPLLILDANQLANNGFVLDANADGSTLRGFVLRDFASHAVWVQAGSDNHSIVGNYVGSMGAGGTDQGAGETNLGAGIYVDGAGSTIGGTTAATRNVIGGNQDGVVFNGSSATGNTIIGNYIGTDATGNTVLSNTQDGVRLQSGASGNTVGGSLTSQRNIISGNGQDGVQIADETSDGNTVRGNWIGVNAAGSASLGNGGDGIYISGGADNTAVGGTGANDGNWIASPGVVGIEVDGASTGTVIQGNRVGTDLAGTANWGAQENAILLENGASNTTIGVHSGAGGNVLAYAGQGGVYTAGISIDNSSSVGNAVFGNTNRGHVGLAIDLDTNGVTANDAAPDSDTGPNNLQNFPVLATARTNASNQLILTGTLTSATNSFYRIHFYSSTSQHSSGYGPAETYLGFADVPTNGSGVGSISTTLAVNVPVGSFITATATRATDGTYSSFTDTSELARNIATVSSTQAVVTVDTTSDTSDGDTSTLSTLLANKGADGLISLREAITAANNSANGASPDLINFAISGTGVHTITPATALPAITDAVVLDATSDDSFAANGNRPAIVLDGNDGAFDGLQLTATADGSTIKGLVVRDFGNSGIYVMAGSDNHSIVGNYIGAFDSNGQFAAGEGIGGSAVLLAGSGSTIGGATAADRNVIAGAGASGVWIESASGNTVLGNYIGLAADGSTVIGNNWDGVTVANSTNNRIGGTGAGEGNRIAGSGDDGIEVNAGSGTGNALLGNIITGSASLGIDLGGNNSTPLPNDTGDADIGGNNLQNYPVLSGALTNGSFITLSGRLNSEANSFYRIELYANSSGNGTGNGEGQTYLGAVNVATNAAGDAAFAVSFAAAVPPGQAISATATRATDGSYTSFTNTSEFAANIVAAAYPVAPANTVPGAQTTAEDTARVFSSANGNAINIADSDAGGANNQVTLSVTNGTLTLGSTAGLSFVSGDGTADASMVVRGTAAAINAALNGLSFSPTANYNGGAVLTIANVDSVLLSLDIDTGLVGRYAFESTGNLGQDSSPAGANTASTMNSPAAVVDGSRGNVIELNGNNGLQAAGVMGSPANVTLAAWVKLTAPDSFGAEVISLGDRISLRIDQAGQMYGQHYNGSTFEGLAFTTTLAGTGWHHVAFTFDDTNNTRTLYLDGVAVASQSTSDSVNYAGATSTVIGRNGAGGTSHDFTGRIDEARIYNRALTAQEIAALADDLALVDTDGVAITVTAVNDAPQLSTTGSANSFTENGAALAVDAGLVLSDVDSASLTGATVSISAGFVTTQDQLLFANQNGISGSWNASTGVLTLSGTATVAQYQTALRSVQYINASDAPNTAARTISFSATDGSATSTTAQRTLNVTAVNDAPTFSSGTGLVTTDVLGNAGDFINAMVVQPDGKTLVAGYSSINGGDIVLARYNLDGSLDSSFGGGDGLVTLDQAGGYEIGQAMTLLSDGRILVVGRVTNDIVLAQFNADGTLDTTFGGGDGVTTAGISGGMGYGVKVQADGKILVGGRDNSNMLVARFLSNGTLDTSFGTSGSTSIDFAGGTDIAYSMALQADGNILLGGVAFTGVSFDAALVRLTSSGALDTGFNGTGRVTTDIGTNSSDTGYAMALQADGKIVLSGWSDAAGNTDFFTVRYNSNGTLDTGFSGDGKVTTSFGTGSDLGQAVAVQPDGKIVVAGQTSTGGNNFGVVRYNADGTLDTTFNGSGIVDTNFQGSSDDRAAAIAFQLDGRITVAGTSTMGGNHQLALARYTSAGALDTRLNVANTLGGTVSHTEGGAATVLDSNVMVFDVELAAVGNYNGATLTLQRNGGAQAQDVYSATGTLSALTPGAALVVGGTTIGTVTTNSAGTLLLSFNASATQALVNSALQQIAYANSSDTPPASVQLDWLFSDGNAGAQGSGGALTASGSSTVNITATNDAPVFTSLNGSPVFTDGGQAVVLDADVTVTDAEATAADNFNGASLTLARDGGAQAQDVYSATGTLDSITAPSGNLVLGGVTIGTYTQSSGTLVFSFNGAATQASVNAAMQQIAYSNTSSLPPAGVQINWVFSDGNAGAQGTGGALSASGFTLVSNSSANDPPVIFTNNQVTDGSFENGGTGWTSNASLEVSSAINSYGIGAPPNGKFFAEVEGYSASGVPSWIETTVSTVAGQTYQFTISAVSRNNWNVGDQGLLSVDGSQVLAFTTGTTWADVTTSFVASSSTTVIRITSNGSVSGMQAAPGDGSGLIVDNVRVVSLTPAVAFTENGSPVVLSPNGSVADAELTEANNFNGATLTLARNGGANAQDLFSATGTLASISAASGNLVLSGLTIGTYTQAGGTLVLSFNSNATNAHVNSAMQQIAYANSSESPPASLQIDWVFNDGNAGAQGSGGARTASDSTTVNITAINDAPVLADTALTMAVAEDAGPPAGAVGALVSAFVGGISDVDSGASSGIAITATDETHGTWYYSLNGGASWAAVGAVNAGSSLLLANDGNSRLYFDPAANWNGTVAAALTLRAWDQSAGSAGTKVSSASNGGTTAFSSITDSVDLGVMAVNDAPSATPASASGAEDDAAIAITLGGSDIDGTVTQFRLSSLPVHGTLFTDAGLTTLATTATDYAASGQALTLYFVPAAHWNGSDSFQFQTRDDSGALSSASATASITVSAVNDAPVNTVPGVMVTPKDTTLVLSGTRAISVADVDAASIEVSISVDTGSLTLATTAGLSFSSGDGSADSAMVFTGSAAAINAALDGLSFAPSNGFEGAATLTITSSDLGGSGSGGTLIDTDTVPIQVGAARFQEGFAGYAGTEDTHVLGASPNTDLGSSSTVVADDNSSGEAALLRFGNLFGNGPGQIPWGSTIISASFSIYVTHTDENDSVGIYSMLGAWSEGSTYNSLVGGVQANGSEAGAAALITFSAGRAGWLNFTGAASIVQGWANGGTNNGFAFLSNSADAWAFASSEYSTAALRPYITINYTPPQPASVTASGGSASFTENGAAVAVDPGLVLSDADSSQLTGATVAISAGFVSGQDVLAFTDQSGITGNWNSATGVLTLTGTATVAQYQAALRSVSYSNSSEAFSTTPRTISFSVQDTWIAGGSDTRNITMVAVNDAPSLSNGALVALTGTDENTPSAGTAVSTILAGAGWADVDAAPAQGMAVTAATGNGTWQYSTDGISWTDVGPVSVGNALLLNASSQLRYVPDNLNGETASISFRAWDQSTGTASGNASPVYAAPGAGGGSTAYSAASASAGMAVSAVNDAPVINATSLTLSEGQTVTLSPANVSVSDPDNSSFVFTVSGLTGGFFQLSSSAGTPISSFTSADLAAGLVQFVDEGDEVAPTFSLTASDGALSSNTLAASISYTPVNDAPVITALSLTLSEGQTVTLSPANVSVSDPDSSSFVFTVSGLTGGFFQLSSAVGTAVTSFTSAQLAAGLVQFVDDGDEVAPTFNLTASDGALNSNTLAASISYTPVNDAPVINAFSLTLNEGQTVRLSPANVSVSDPDSSSFVFTVSGLTGGFFQLSSSAGTPISSFTSADLAAGLVQFVDDGDEVAPTFSLTASDGALSSNTLAASISYTPVNDAPVINALSLTLSEGQTVTLSPANVSVSDPDSSSFVFTVSGSTGGFFQLSSSAGTPISSFTSADLAAGLVQFVDDGDEVAPAFSLTASDGALSSNTLAASISYTPVNDAPVLLVNGSAQAQTLSVNENQTAGASVSGEDVDSPVASLRLSIVGGEDAALFAIDPVSGALSFINAPDFERPTDADRNGIYAVRVRVQDGAGAFGELELRLRVADANDAPQLELPAQLELPLQPRPGDVVAKASGTDQDAGDSLRFALLADADGRFSIDAVSGDIRYTGKNAASENSGTTHSVIVEVIDATGARRQQILSLVVPGKLNAPAEPTGPKATGPAEVSNEPVTGPVAPTKVSATESTEAPAVPDGTSGAGVDERALRDRLTALLESIETAGNASSQAGLRNGTGRNIVSAAQAGEGGTLAAFGLEAVRSADSDSSLDSDGGNGSRLVDLMGRLWAAGGRAFGSTDAESDDALLARTPRETEAAEQLILQITQPARVTGVALSVGFVWYLTRGGGMLASAMMGVPAWKQVDLLTIMSGKDEEEEPEDDDEDLKELFDKKSPAVAG